MIARTAQKAAAWPTALLARRFGAVSVKGEAGRFSVPVYNKLDPLANKIDSDKPHIYCLLMTESWNPQYGRC